MLDESVSSETLKRNMHNIVLASGYYVLFCCCDEVYSTIKREAFTGMVRDDLSKIMSKNLANVFVLPQEFILDFDWD